METTPPIIIDWKGLKKLGWPYCRTHTWRLMDAGKFPQCRKLFDETRNSHPVWVFRDVLTFLKDRGLYTEPTVVIEIS
jgi:hypothetical protein